MVKFSWQPLKAYLSGHLIQTVMEQLILGNLKWASEIFSELFINFSISPWKLRNGRHGRPSFGVFHRNEYSLNLPPPYDWQKVSLFSSSYCNSQSSNIKLYCQNVLQLEVIQCFPKRISMCPQCDISRETRTEIKMGFYHVWSGWKWLHYKARDAGNCDSNIQNGNYKTFNPFTIAFVSRNFCHKT